MSVKWIKVLKLSLIPILLFAVGCASHIPLTASMNDFVLLGIKANNSDTVRFVYETKVVDGTLKQSSLIEHSEGTVFGLMIQDYMQNKFTKMSPEGDVVIKVTQTDFEATMNVVDSTGTQVAKALFGGTQNYMMKAQVKINVLIERDGKQMTKNISGTSESPFSSKGSASKDVIARTHGENINKANNKVLMLLNAYFEEIGL